MKLKLLILFACICSTVIGEPRKGWFSGSSSRKSSSSSSGSRSYPTQASSRNYGSSSSYSRQPAYNPGALSYGPSYQQKPKASAPQASRPASYPSTNTGLYPSLSNSKPNQPGVSSGTKPGGVYQPSAPSYGTGTKPGGVYQPSSGTLSYGSGYQANPKPQGPPATAPIGWNVGSNANKPVGEVYKPPASAPVGGVYKPPASAPAGGVYKPPASAPVGPSTINTKPKPSAPVGAPPAYPGLQNVPAAKSPPAYSDMKSKYTPAHKVDTKPAQSGVKPYGAYPTQAAPVGPPVNAYNTRNSYGYPSGGYGYPGNQGVNTGGYGYPHGAPAYGGAPHYGGGYGGAPTYGGGYGGAPHYGGGYGAPPSYGGGYGAPPSYGGGYQGYPTNYGGHGFGGFGGGAPTIINNIPAGYGYQQKSGSSFGLGGIGTTLLTAGAFYGLGRLTAPSSGGLLGSSYGGYGSNTQHIYHHHEHVYDHSQRVAGTTAPPPSDPLPPLVPIANYPGTPQNTQQGVQQTPQNTQQGIPMTGTYASNNYGYTVTPKPAGISPAVAALAGLGTGAATAAVASSVSNQIPTVDLNKTQLYVPTIVNLNETYTGPIDYWPLWLNDSIEILPFYAYNYPTWNETEIIPVPQIDVRLQTIQEATTTPEPKIEGFAAKLEPILLEGREGIEPVLIAPYPHGLGPKKVVVIDVIDAQEKVELAVMPLNITVK